MKTKHILQAVTKCLVLVCSSIPHCEDILFSMVPVTMEEAPGHSSTLLEFLCTTLVHTMGYGVYRPGCWGPLLPKESSGDVSEASFPVFMPVQIPSQRDHLSKGPHACQLVAAAALVALALQPDKHPLPCGGSAQFRGPFRQLLVDMGLMQHLLDLEREPWHSPRHLKLAQNVTAAGLLSLSAPGTALPRNHLQLTARYLASRAAAEDVCVEECQLLSGCLWLLLRNQHNLAYLVDTSPVLQTVAELLRGCVRFVMQAEAPPDASVPWNVGAAADLLGEQLPSVEKGMELLVLVLWRVLEVAAARRRVPDIDLESSCFARTNTAWWQLRMDFRYLLVSIFICHPPPPPSLLEGLCACFAPTFQHGTLREMWRTFVHLHCEACKPSESPTPNKFCLFPALMQADSRTVKQLL
jgi:hypothetical protein